MRTTLAAVLALCVAVATASAQPLEADPAALADVARALQAPNAAESPVVFQTEEGFIRFLDAPAGGRYAAPASKSATPAAVALAFVDAHAAAFGALSDDTAFAVKRVAAQNGVAYVRLDQTYAGYPVLGAQSVVGVAGGGVVTVNSDLLRDTRDFDRGALPLVPLYAADAAVARARTEVAAAHPGMGAPQLNVQGEPELLVHAPGVLGMSGTPGLAWSVTLIALAPEPVGERVLIDAHTGALRLRYSLLDFALEREIYDANGQPRKPPNPVRREGQDPSAVADVNTVYDFLGDTYGFYFDEHGWDSFDGEGSPLVATVRLPFFNAFWFGAPVNEMYYGSGLAVDDVTAHEITHGVTENKSSLIYVAFSGAINESFSDMWGEFVDLTNGAGNDDDDVRWLVCEDCGVPLDEEDEGKGGEKTPPPQRTDTLAFRSMSDPPLFGHPDRLGSDLLFPIDSPADNGGVHSNSGIGNKLCYLLVDGDAFNGETVRGMGIPRVADLFFACQDILTESSDYFDLYLAMGAASKAMGMSLDDRLNVAAAGRAVEIDPPTLSLAGARGFRATPVVTEDDGSAVAVTWVNAPASAFESVTLVRSLGRFVNEPAEGEVLLRGRGDRFLDENVSEGITYFYTLIVDTAAGFPQILYSRATAGGAPASALSEAFGLDPLTGLAKPFDLSFSQLLFTPVGAPQGVGGAAANRTYEDYELTRREGVFSFPVAREDGEGAAFSLPLTEDGAVQFSMGAVPFPFFGRFYSTLYFGANGYVGFDRTALAGSLNFPSLAAHFAVPRISYLFSDLAPEAGGETWARSLPDRVAFTVENMPEYSGEGSVGFPPVNSVQVELFFSGHIRITYGAISAGTALVGLSDGGGAPLDPADLFDGVEPVDFSIDLSEAAAEPARLSIEPVPLVRGDAGDRIAFEVRARVPAGGDTPVFVASWDGPGAPPLADLGNGLARFEWQSGPADEGIFTLRVQAQADGDAAFQDVRLLIGPTAEPPVAADLALSSGTPFEDPTLDRFVDAGRPLTAAYTYRHPLAETDPVVFGEGESFIYWFRNNEAVGGLINQRSVPPQVPRPGERWYFQVLPVSAAFIAGPLATSPIVTIAAMPQVLRVTPAFGLVGGGDTVLIEGARLGPAPQVAFGGVPAARVRVIGDAAIEAVTPLHPAGAVEVTVTTAAGMGRLAAGYTFVEDLNDLLGPDVNRDGKVDALDVQIVVRAVLDEAGVKAAYDTDINGDGRTNTADVQAAVNAALRR